MGSKGKTIGVLVAGLAGFALGGCGEEGAQAPSLPDQTFATELPAPTGRALQLEDYYLGRAVRGVQLSPAGDWIAFSAGLPVEETNGTLTESWIVPADASASARRILHAGRDVAGVSWTPDGLLLYAADGMWTLDPADPSASPRPATRVGDEGNTSPDGLWSVSVEDVPQDPAPEAERTEFQLRHEERFQGVQFDWLSFQRDGAPFPAPDPTAGAPGRSCFLRRGRAATPGS